MPLPLFLGIAAGVTAIAGVGTGVHGASEFAEAKKTSKAAQERHEKNMKKFDRKNKQTTEAMDLLGKKEIEILSSFEHFSDLIEKIQNRPEFADIELNGNVLPKYNGEELKKVSIGACALVGGLSGAAMGTAGGFAAAGATTAAVMAFGTASTGTAIASLSGAAATNATLAALGGGAIAAGGGGIALGTTILGAATAGVGLLVGGIIFSLTGASTVKKADEAYTQTLKAEKQINEICSYLTKLKTVASNYKEILYTADRVYRSHLEKVEYTVEKEGKTDWLTYNEEEKLNVQNTVLLVGLLYKMCNVKIVLTSDKEDSLNTINHTDVEDATKAAISVMEYFGETIGTPVEDADADADKFMENPDFCVATIAVIVYFAKCDGVVNDAEQKMLDGIVSSFKDNLALTDYAKSRIEEIVSSETFTFFQMRKYLDVVGLNELSSLEKTVNKVIGANKRIKNAEKVAKEKFNSYFTERKKLEKN